MKIYGDLNSGNCLKVKWVCDRLALPYGWIGVDIKLVGGLFMRAEWEYVRFVDQVDTSVNTVRAGLGYKF